MKKEKKVIARNPRSLPEEHVGRFKSEFPEKIVVVCDAFRIGGRETYLSTYLAEIKRRHDVSVFLVAGEISDNAELGIFDSVAAIGRLNAGRAGAALGAATSSGLPGQGTGIVWAQHYGLADAWRLAMAWGWPLIANFHGPLDTVGRPDALADALGIALAIDRRLPMAAVSNEIANSLVTLGADPECIAIVPNRVKLPAVARTRVLHSASAKTRIVMLTRAQKFEHMRAAVKFLTLWRQSVGPASLRIVSDLAAPSGERTFWSDRSRTLKILGRKWVLRNPSVLPALRSVEFSPPSADPLAEYQQADLALGMGRALLEGVSVGLPGVLVGYRSVIDLVSGSNFEDFAQTNFSGRGCQPEILRDVVYKTARQLQSDTPCEAILSKIDVEKSCDPLTDLMRSRSDNSYKDHERVIRILDVLEACANKRDGFDTALPMLETRGKLALTNLAGENGFDSVF